MFSSLDANKTLHSKKGCASENRAFSCASRKQKERGRFSATLSIRQKGSKLSAGHGRDRDHPSPADRASGARARPTTYGCDSSTTLVLHGAHASSGRLACCCNRAFQPRGPAHDPREPAFAGKRRLHTLAALLLTARCLQASLPRKRIGPGLSSIYVSSWLPFASRS